MPPLSPYLVRGNLVDRVILPTRGLFRAVRPQGPANSAQRTAVAVQLLRKLEATYLRGRVGNRCLELNTRHANKSWNLNGERIFIDCDGRNKPFPVMIKDVQVLEILKYSKFKLIKVVCSNQVECLIIQVT